MEQLLHSIEELQRMAADLAQGGVDAVRYEEDCEVFFERMEDFVAVNCYEQADFLASRINQVRAQMNVLMRQVGDLEHTKNLVTRGLDGVYRSVMNPPVERGDEDYSDA